MPIFESTEKMYETLGDLFRTLLADPVAGPKFREADLVIRFVIDSPNGEIWLTRENEVICGVPEDMKATVTMTLSGDTCHKFWLKQITMPVALAKGKIKAKGPMPKVLKLLPILKPAYEAYPAIAAAHGLA
ncbi:MAG: SCP2 sterol-binding domain-containing protein [Deltaproteobacteria bacterium]|nr:SCP2 sterol-binding domain-containing protein [Deltaproteobacteria bacterium]